MIFYACILNKNRLFVALDNLVEARLLVFNFEPNQTTFPGLKFYSLHFSVAEPFLDTLLTYAYGAYDVICLQPRNVNKRMIT